MVSLILLMFIFVFFSSTTKSTKDRVPVSRHTLSGCTFVMFLIMQSPGVPSYQPSNIDTHAFDGYA